MRPEFCFPILEILKQKLNSLPPKDRIYSIRFNEMSLRVAVTYVSSEDNICGFEHYGGMVKNTADAEAKLANYALVFMVRGIISKWKQPFGFFFSL